VENKILNEKDLLICCRNKLAPINPIVNEGGVLGLLQYRKNNNKKHPDSLLTDKKYSWIAEFLYGGIPESVDTIFNCWSMIKLYDAVHNGTNESRDSNTILECIRNGQNIFRDEHKKEFDLLADRQHSIANFMPAPKGFNGWAKNCGKGEYNQDNDFPDIYYKRAENEFPDMYEWIQNNMELYSLEVFKEKITPWENGKANFRTMKIKPTEGKLFNIAKRMNELLKDRAKNLIKRSKKDKL